MSDKSQEEKPTQPSGVKSEAECPSDHDIPNYVIDNPCISCGAQV